MTPVSLRFTGSGKEYFKIWIVNILLTIITLGIYSAWAKVRNTRYFYGNTLLDNAPFEYHANPIQILKGRLIAFTVLALYVLTASYLPLLNALLALLVALFVPVIITKALHFKMVMSSYRNIRFGFDQTHLGAAYGAYFFFPIIAFLTAYILWPWVHKEMSKYRVSHLFYGDSRFQTDLKTGRYFLAYFLAVILSLLLFIVLIGIAGSMTGALDELLAPEGPQELSPAMISAGMLLLLALFAITVLFRAVTGAMITNHIYDHTNLDETVYFGSKLKVTKLFWIYLTNILGIVLTLGLFIPWAKVRHTRYRVESTQVKTREPLDEFTAAKQSKANALGDEFGDAFGIDVMGSL